MKHIQVLIQSLKEKKCEAWADFLSRRGWEVHVCRGCGELAQAAGEGSINLILLEESLAGEIPANPAKIGGGAAAVILFSKPGALTNNETAEYLKSGYADIVPSDIDPRVLEAKLLVNLRWTLPISAQDMEEVRSRSGMIKVNKAHRKVTIRKSRGLSEISSLTHTELEILSLLVGREGDVVERKFILDSIWRDKVVNMENVDKHVEALRAKLARLGGNIETVYGSGYCYREKP